MECCQTMPCFASYDKAMETMLDIKVVHNACMIVTLKINALAVLKIETQTCMVNWPQSCVLPPDCIA